MCDQDVAASIRNCVINLSEKKVAACYLGSDGVEDSYRNMDGTHLFYQQLSCDLADHNFGNFDVFLDEKLTELSREGSADDVSVAGIVSPIAIRKLLQTFKINIRNYNLLEEKQSLESKLASMERKHSVLYKRCAETQKQFQRYRDADVKRQQALTNLEQKKARERMQREQERLRVQKNEQEGIRLTIIGVVIIIAALVIDFVLTLSLKDVSSICRWLWLPLISLGISVIVGPILTSFCDNVYVGDWILPFWMIGSGIWGAIRGIIVVVAYFKASSGWAVLGAIFLCLFMFIFNSFSYFVSAGICSKNN